MDRWMVKCVCSRPPAPAPVRTHGPISKNVRYRHELVQPLQSRLSLPVLSPWWHLSPEVGQQPVVAMTLHAKAVLVFSLTEEK